MTHVSWADAQNHILSSAFHNGPEVWQLVDPSELADMYREVGAAMKAITDKGKVVDMATLSAECARRGISTNANRWLLYPIPASDAYRVFSDARARMRIEQALLRGAQQIADGADHWDIADELVGGISGLERPAVTREKQWHDWSEVMAMDPGEPNWVMPGLLAHDERLVLTGMEGHGKSTLVYQLLLGAAYGVSPLDPTKRFTPQRVLVLDVENVVETQIAAQYRMMQAAYRSKATDAFRTPDIRLMRNRYIDLSRPGDRRALIDVAEQVQPDLLFMGSGYRLADGTQDHRTVAMSIQQTADTIRANTGCAVIIETHAGHGFQNDRNGWRPDGSSYWMRWPEFGFGLAPVKVRSGRMARIVKWRGDRVVGRDWPAGFKGGGVMPWLPVEEAEIEMDEVS